MEDSYFKQLLNDRSLKATANRMQLLSSIKNYASAMPYSSIQQAMANVDRVTLYRTLETLLQKGIIHRALTENNETYYAICGHSCSQDAHHHEHIHFKCTACKTVSCQELPQSLTITLPGFTIQDMKINASGTCANCSVL